MKKDEYISIEKARENPWKTRNETEINNLLDKFKALVMRILAELGKRIDEHSENFDEELENTEKDPVRTELYTITEMKNTLEGMNSRLGITDLVSDLEETIMEITQSEWQKEEQIFKNETIFRVSF